MFESGLRAHSKPNNLPLVLKPRPITSQTQTLYMRLKDLNGQGLSERIC